MNKPKRNWTVPSRWKCEADAYKHSFYRAFSQQRNQAQWRGEIWELTFDEWFDFWGEDIKHRGRGSDNLAMVRRDYTLPWRPDNCYKITRREHGAIQGQMRIEKNRRKQNGKETV